MKIVKQVWITGMGAVTPWGNSVDSVCFHLEKDKKEDGDFSSSEMGVEGVKWNEEDLKSQLKDKKKWKILDQRSQFLLKAAFEARDQAGLGEGPLGERCGIVVGIDPDHFGEKEYAQACENQKEGQHFVEAFQNQIHPLWLLKRLPNMGASHLAMELGSTGVSQTIALSAHSGHLAVEHAMALIQTGEADIVFCGVTETHHAFEGAWVLVLESWEHMQLRSGLPVAEIEKIENVENLPKELLAFETQNKMNQAGMTQWMMRLIMGTCYLREQQNKLNDPGSFSLKTKNGEIGIKSYGGI